MKKIKNGTFNLLLFCLSVGLLYFFIAACSYFNIIQDFLYNNNINGYFYDDFNDALGELFSDSSFISLLADIEDNQELVSSLMKDLKNPYTTPSKEQVLFSAMSGSTEKDAKIFAEFN